MRTEKETFRATQINLAALCAAFVAGMAAAFWICVLFPPASG